MLKYLKTQGRMHEVAVMAILSAICFCLSVFRFFYTDTFVFLFLNWNLFLAFVPWILSTIAIASPKLQKNKTGLGILLFVWILFFPNAPYILTDLFHLRGISSMPIWFDLLLILSFAWAGLMFGFISLMNIERLLEKYIPRLWIPAVSCFLLFAGSFGVYVGRYLRWNSWDVIREPFGLFHDIGSRQVFPFDHPRTWGMTLLMGVFLNMIYWSLKIIRKKNEKQIYHLQKRIPQA